MQFPCVCIEQSDLENYPDLDNLEGGYKICYRSSDVCDCYGMFDKPVFMTFQYLFTNKK